MFTLLDDGLAYVEEGDKVFDDPGGAEGVTAVPRGRRKRRSSPPRNAPVSASSLRSSALSRRGR